MTKRGLVLVVGATGSGKSTTLAAMINHRNETEAGHIMTIEDPIEFVHEHKKCVVSQREVGVDTDSFKAALKNALRQAPTVILIGEIRDEETMEHAMNFAETGHLCLATLHSNNANQAMERVLNFFPPDRHRQMYLQLSLNLKAIVSQRLMKTIDGGRAAAIEILLGSARIKELIKKGEVDSIKEAMSQGSNDGMQTFDAALFNLCVAGKISMDEALQNADNVTDLKLRFKLEGSKKSSQEACEEESGGFELDREVLPNPSA
jgi:twitching motility protein PilU